MDAHIVRDGADNDGRLALLALDLRGDLGDREGRAVHAAHKETLEDDLVKVGGGPASQEPVELEMMRDEQPGSKRKAEKTLTRSFR